MNIARLASAATFALLLTRHAGAERPTPDPLTCPASFDGEASHHDEATARSLAGKDAYRVCEAASDGCEVDCQSAFLEPGACYRTGVVNDDGTVLSTYFTCTAALYPLSR